MADPVKQKSSLLGTDLEMANEENPASSQHAESTSENKALEDKPEASEEIMIEEISIDGMCGVY